MDGVKEAFVMSFYHLYSETTAGDADRDVFPLETADSDIWLGTLIARPKAGRAALAKAKARGE